MSVRATLLIFFTLVGCGAPSTPAREPAAVAPSPAVIDSSAEVPPTAAASEDAPAETPLAPRAAAQPVEVEAGVRLGPIRIGMTPDEVRSLGLAESTDGRYGPYRVGFRDGRAERVEAIIGQLGAIRMGERTFESGVHIHVLRDAIGDCQWTEGGGERYRCANGRLHVHTTHSMSPERYTIAVSGR